MASAGAIDRAFDELLHDVYEAALEPARIKDVMPKVCDWLECDSSHLGAWDKHRESMTFSLMPPELVHVEKLYAQHYWKCDIRRPVIEAKGIEGYMDACQNYYDDRAVSRSEFYQDLLIPKLDGRYGAGGMLVKNADRMVFVVYNRSSARGEFTPDIMARLNRITPHLQRMIRIMRNTESTRQAAESGAQALKGLSQGMLLLNRQGDLLYANGLAEQVLREGLVCASVGSRLATGRQAVNDLGDMCARAVRTGVTQTFSESIGLRDGSVETYCFTINPVRPECMSRTRVWMHADLVVFFTLTRAAELPSQQQFNGWFGLTPAEARLARALASGQSVVDYSNQAGVKSSTARTQVRALLEKTQQASLQDLTALLARLPSTEA